MKLLWLVSAAIAIAISVRKKERWFFAIANGLLFGPIGIVFAIVSRGRRGAAPRVGERALP